ncbi:MAG: hypothetical protein P4M14_01150 [Gammaproteobacteria bacterium]|nr:hypothetical protein [Gammaproteobacteria bacterium]
MASNRINSYQSQAFQSKQGDFFIAEIAHEPKGIVQCRFNTYDEALNFFQWVRNLGIFDGPINIEQDRRNHANSAIKGDVAVIRFSAEDYFLLSSLAIQDQAPSAPVAEEPEEMKYEGGREIIPPALHHPFNPAPAMMAAAAAPVVENNPVAAIIANKLEAKDEAGVAKTLAEIDKVQNDIAAREEQTAFEKAVRLSQLDQAARDALEKTRLEQLALATAKAQAEQAALEKIRLEQSALAAAKAQAEQAALLRKENEVKLAREQEVKAQQEKALAAQKEKDLQAEKAARANKLEELARQQQQIAAAKNLAASSAAASSSSVSQPLPESKEDVEEAEANFSLALTDEELQMMQQYEETAAVNHENMRKHQTTLIASRPAYLPTRLNGLMPAEKQQAIEEIRLQDAQVVSQETVDAIILASKKSLSTFSLFSTKANAEKNAGFFSKYFQPSPDETNDAAMQTIYNRHVFNSIGSL